MKQSKHAIERANVYVHVYVLDDHHEVVSRPCTAAVKKASAPSHSKVLALKQEVI